MSKLFQISEDDLATLERDIPELASEAMPQMSTNRQRSRIRRIKEILSTVRWRYGPWGDVTVIPADGEPESED